MEEELSQLTNDPAYQRNAFITEDDLKSLGSLTGQENEALIILRAPTGSSLEVPEPSTIPENDPEKYQLFLKTDTGKISVYIVSAETNILGDDNRDDLHNTNLRYDEDNDILFKSNMV